MSQAMTSPEATYGRPGYPDRIMQRGSAVSTSRRRKQPIARVPMLDWPADLFGDSATLPELVTVDFLLQCDPVDCRHTNH